MASRITAKLEAYTKNPGALDNVVTEMVGKDYMRMRVGDYRVLFRETATEITVLDLGPRGGIYD